MTFTSPLPSGGVLNLNASARDAAGNTGTATGVSVQVGDVVAPTVTAVVPANGATDVDPTTSVVVTFSEPMNRTTLTTASVRLTAGAASVPAALTIGADDRTATLTPASPLAVNTLFTVTVDAAVSDPAGNPLGSAFVSTFRTATPDATAPRVESIDPPDGATGVPTTAPVSVTFTEPIDPASVTPTSFRVSTGGSPVSGTFSFLNGGRTARFTPATPWPFEAVVTTELTGAITDVSHNALVTAAGLPITTPLTFTFLTGNFAITSPAGTEVIENTNITLAAQASAALNVASVAFSVNGAALPAVTTAPFSIGFNVPRRTSAQTLTIVASARNAANAEIARAEKVVSVVGGLTATPTLLGIPRGATRPVRLSVDEALATDLVINLSTSDAQVATVGTSQVTLPAGQTSVTATVRACTTCPGDPAPVGKALGNTALVATSARGPAVTIVSVSDPVVGQQLTPLAAPTGLAISLPPSAGNVFTSAGRTVSVSISLRGQPLAGTTPLAVTVTSSNANIATATATAIQPGQQVTTLTIDGLADGIAVLTVRAGDDVRSFTVFVGAPPANQTPLALAPPTGVSISRPPSVGQVVTAAGRTSNVIVQALPAPLAGSTPLAVTVSSGNPAVATATATAVQPGTQVTTLTITAVSDGVAVLTLRAGTEVRTLTVFVGPPPANQTPIVVALPTGVSVTGLPFIGAAFAPTGSTVTLGVLLLQSAGSRANQRQRHEQQPRGRHREQRNRRNPGRKSDGDARSDDRCRRHRHPDVGSRHAASRAEDRRRQRADARRTRRSSSRHPQA